MIVVGGTTLSFIQATKGSAVEFHSPFDINSVSELCREAALMGCLPGLQGMRTSTAFHGWRTSAPVPLLSPVPSSPYSPGQLPIPFWDTMTLSFDSWGCICCHWTFLSPPLSRSHLFLFLSVYFWRSLIWAQRQVGWLSSALNESMWNCSCLFDLRFSFLDSRPRYWQRDVTSPWARSKAVWSACTRAHIYVYQPIRTPDNVKNWQDKR